MEDKAPYGEDYDVEGGYRRDMNCVIRDTGYKLSVSQDLVPGMRVPGKVYVGDAFADLLGKEMRDFHESKRFGCIPSLVQIANVATLPGIVGSSIGLPDIHSGYGFAVGHVAAFDLDDPEAVVSPGGVGYDINCGVRLIRTNLTREDVDPVKERLLDELFSRIPVGAGGKNNDIVIDKADLNRLLQEGMQWAVEKGYSWPEDPCYVEDKGCIAGACAENVSQRCISRGIPQLGTLGSGNHYVEVQVVDHIFDEEAAAVMGITKVGQVCIMLHCGSRGLGHQVCEDAVKVFDEKLRSEGINLVDRQLSCYKASSEEAKRYLSGMAAAANFAFVNRSIITYLIRDAFAKIFQRSPQELDLSIVYDVAHNIAKVEEHLVEDGRGEKIKKRLLVHRKGSTRAFGPGHPAIPDVYRSIGQPVLVGGSMGTCSYVLTGTERAMSETFGSTCHGAGRALGRNRTRKLLQPGEVIDALNSKNISIRVGQMNAVVEEAPEAYKDVSEVVNICEAAGISHKVFRLTPLGVIKG